MLGLQHLGLTYPFLASFERSCGAASSPLCRNSVGVAPRDAGLVSETKASFPAERSSGDAASVSLAGIASALPRPTLISGVMAGVISGIAGRREAIGRLAFGRVCAAPKKGGAG